MLPRGSQGAYLGNQFPGRIRVRGVVDPVVVEDFDKVWIVLVRYDEAVKPHPVVLPLLVYPGADRIREGGHDEIRDHQDISLLVVCLCQHLQCLLQCRQRIGSTVKAHGKACHQFG